MPRGYAAPSSRERRWQMHGMARLLAVVLTATLALAVYGTASAQAPPDVQAWLTAETDEEAPPTVGDPITLTLTVSHPPDYRVTFPRLPYNWGAFEVRDQSAVENIANPDGSRATRQSIDAVLFETGDFTSPDVSISVRDTAGQVHDMAVSGASITVASVLQEGEEPDPRDIKPPAEVYEPPLSGFARTVYERGWIIAGAVLALLLLAAVYLLMRGRGAATPVDTRPPHQVALEELHRIEALDLPSQSRFKEHYTLVTDCIRRYLERAFDTRALDRTTDELRVALESSTMAPDHADVTMRLLEESDLVKFTKLPPEVEDARASTVRALSLVVMTAPMEPATSEKAGA